MTCLRGDFLEHALQVQRAALPGSIATVRMLEREIAQHPARCGTCRRRERWLQRLDDACLVVIDSGHLPGCISLEPEDALDARSCDCGFASALRFLEDARL